MNFISGNVIRDLRMKNKMTQKDLAEKLCLSDKTVSKWETGKGIPDIGILDELANALNVSVAEILTGNVTNNENVSANMKKISFYVCPLCGNVIHAIGEGSFSCHGILLPSLESEDANSGHEIRLEEIDGEFYVSMEHDMTKKHYISFFAYVTSNGLQMIKLYPEQSAECRFTKRGHGVIYGYCNRHGLFAKRI